MEKRRVLFTLGVTYDTPHDKLALIPEIIKSVVGKFPTRSSDARILPPTALTA
jgi:hypothetical protein